MSVVIPVYNVQDYVKDCLDSILDQTYQMIEIIAVDDGSQDASPQILKEYSKRYSNFHTSLQKQNKGQAVARNIGIDLSKGKYILFVDSDDFIESNTIEVLVEAIEKYHVDFVRFNAKSFAEDDETIRQEEYNFNLFLNEYEVYKKEAFKNVYLSFSPSPVLYLFTRELIEKNQIRFMEYIIHEDELYSSDIFLYAESCVYVDQPFYNRRYRSGSTMTEKSEEQLKYSFDSYIKIIEQYNKLLFKGSFTQKQKQFLKYRINSLYVPLLGYAIDPQYKKENLEKVNKGNIFYTKTYKNYIRLLKAVTITQKKVGLK